MSLGSRPRRDGARTINFRNPSSSASQPRSSRSGSATVSSSSVFVPARPAAHVIVHSITSSAFLQPGSPVEAEPIARVSSTPTAGSAAGPATEGHRAPTGRRFASRYRPCPAASVPRAVGQCRAAIVGEPGRSRGRSARPCASSSPSGRSNTGGSRHPWLAGQHQGEPGQTVTRGGNRFTAGGPLGEDTVRRDTPGTRPKSARASRHQRQRQRAHGGDPRRLRGRECPQTPGGQLQGTVLRLEASSASRHVHDVTAGCLASADQPGRTTAPQARLPGEWFDSRRRSSATAPSRGASGVRRRKVVSPPRSRRRDVDPSIEHDAGV